MVSGLKIIKIGGSLITDKRKGMFEVAKEEMMEKIAEQISGKVVIVHGVGSFGHPHVKKFGLNLEGVAKTHLACLRLNVLFCSKLEKFGLSPLPFHPLEFFASNNFDFLIEMIETGFVPVFHGDVIYDGKFRVMSGDEIVRILARELKAERVGFATDKPIILDGEVVKVINPLNFNNVLEKIGKAIDKDDVTGGMRGKLIEAYEIADVCDVYIFNGAEDDAIRKFLERCEVGTKLTKRF